MNLVLTKNFYTWMRTILLGTSTSISATSTATAGWASGGTVVENMVNILGENQSSFPGSSTYLGKNGTLNFWQSGTWFGTYFCIGNDNTPATEDDYKLCGDYVFNTDYTLNHKAIGNPTMVNGKAVLTFNMTFTALTDITIGEIGMFKQIQAASTISDDYLFLFGRVALDTPIQLTAGESATFQVSIEI